ncbi:MAG: glycine cleavage system aminomethyltransferase GcvT [Nitriliruptor sp.]|uniref:glycine cleavage system aminomethyltransferase GcvT n=1 Tax=Nitriliruptor sp. TaxID=2448056 RepID=UPI0034A0AAE9
MSDHADRPTAARPTAADDPDGDLRRTPLARRHLAAGAKLAPFAGWAMPVSFEGVLAEHAAVREDVGLFDVSHLGTVWITGPAATAAVGRAFTADAVAIEDGASRYALCTADDGGIIDDLIVYRLSSSRWLTVPNAANTAAVVERLRRVAEELAEEALPDVAAAAATADPDPVELAVGTVSIDDASAVWAVLAVQGPRSLEVIAAALGVDAASVPWGGVTDVHLGDDGPVTGHLVLCRTGYTGELGAELVVPAELAGEVWDALLSAGATPCGLGARDTLRLEMGYPLHGADLGPDVTPAEARLSWAVQLTDAAGEPRRFPGAVALAAAAVAGPQRRLWGVLTTGRRPLRAGCEVRRGDRVVGTMTSGGFSPTLGVGIGLGLLAADVAPGDQVEVDLRGTAIAGEVVRPPFVGRDPKG